MAFGMETDGLAEAHVLARHVLAHLAAITRLADCCTRTISETTSTPRCPFSPIVEYFVFRVKITLFVRERALQKLHRHIDN